MLEGEGNDLRLVICLGWPDLVDQEFVLVKDEPND